MENTPESTVEDIAIVGMGYVGTSLSAVLAEKGFSIHGVDTDEQLVEMINECSCPIEEERITALFERYCSEGTIDASMSFKPVESANVIIVTVGTPLAESDPDTSAVKAATESIARNVSAGTTIIYRSTLPATTTEKVLCPMIENKTGFRGGDDLFIGFCPERMAEGSAYEDLTQTPVVIGGMTEACRQHIQRFWQAVGLETMAVSSPTTAELAKLADNWWIDLNIALANEVALLSEELGVDAMEVITAANTLPKGQHNVNILYPGAGVGGSCLHKDPWFVTNLGEENGLDLQTPRVSRKVNERMPDHVVELVEREVGDLSGTSVAVLGYSFKGDTDDVRNTPARKIVEGLQNQGADVRVADPYVEPAVIKQEVGTAPIPLDEALGEADAVVVVTGHTEYHQLTPQEVISMVGTEDFILVDGRYVFDKDAFGGTDIRYTGVGRGDNE